MVLNREQDAINKSNKPNLIFLREKGKGQNKTRDNLLMGFSIFWNLF